MLRFMVSITLTLIATANSAQETKWFVTDQSAASESQIKNAIENKYDDTGPGAKTREYAYNTYKTLEEALVAFLDDPDTQLPEHDRERAMQKLLKSQPTTYQSQNIQRFYPKTVEEYNSHQIIETPFTGNKFSSPNNKAPSYFQDRPALSAYQGSDVHFFNAERRPTETFKLHQIRPVKGNPLSLAHYTRDDNAEGQLHSHPKYTFSYGVHNKDTGDSKTAQETRDGDTVRGYYSFLDADGKQRVVHYTAGDKTGFQATVQRGLYP